MDRLVSNKETFEQRPERSAEANHVALWRRSLQAEGEASLNWGGEGTL